MSKIDSYIDSQEKEEWIAYMLSEWHSVPTHKETDISEKLDWCFCYCRGMFRDIKKQDVRYWCFEQEQDAAIFALKFSEK